MLNMTEEGGKLICTFSGRMDLTACTGFQQTVTDKVAELNLPVVFDLKDVDYVSSSFLRIVIHVAKKVGRDRLQLLHLSENVRNVFVLSGLDEQLNIS